MKKEDETPLRTERSGIYKVGKGTLINRDMDALKAYKTRKMKMNEIGVIKDELNQLKNDILEIKQLLLKGK